MEYSEYKDKLSDLKAKHHNEKVALAREYAYSNNPYKVGDTVTDHIGSIRVDRIRVDITDNPCCIYYGIELTKKGVPYKSGSTRGVYQMNIKKL